MADKITPEEFAHLFTRAYMRMDFNSFVVYVLDDIPQPYDTWQMEKFRVFQKTARWLSRMSTEHIENIIESQLMEPRDATH